MTVKDVRIRLLLIAELQRDGEMAHSAEDRLWEDVLRAIARGDKYPISLAAEAVKSRDIVFDR